MLCVHIAGFSPLPLGFGNVLLLSVAARLSESAAVERGYVTMICIVP